jgi:DNA repair protein RadA/Sms
MAKRRSQFLCRNCGGVQVKWAGKCPDCGTWDSLEAYTPPADDPRADVRADVSADNRAMRLDQIDLAEKPRFSTGIGELDRVLGGGIVPGGVTLVGGEPGIGKSTLLLQMAAGRRKRTASDDASLLASALYITSEESAAQTKLRAKRLGFDASDMLVLAETNLERIIHQIDQSKARVVVVDSIQMIYKPTIPAAPGSVTQMRECCTDLTYLAKSRGVSMFLVGHVTKAGTLAGPKLVEHVVDTVLYFEGDRHHSHRIVRGVKNRFGSTHELGLFEMTDRGLVEVKDPGNLLVRPYGADGPPSGSILSAAMTGSRIMVIEIQALTASSVIGAARRKVSGVSGDRVAMILAVLEKRCGIRLADQDVYVNVVGGVKIVEPAIDLAVAMAVAGAYADHAFPPGTLAVGELGLGGEVRSVGQVEQRLKEASRLGIGQAFVPSGTTLPRLGGVAVHEVSRVRHALAGMTFERRRRTRDDESGVTR